MAIVPKLERQTGAGTSYSTICSYSCCRPLIRFTTFAARFIRHFLSYCACPIYRTFHDLQMHVAATCLARFRSTGPFAKMHAWRTRNNSFECRIVEVHTYAQVRSYLNRLTFAVNRTTMFHAIIAIVRTSQCHRQALNGQVRLRNTRRTISIVPAIMLVVLAMIPSGNVAARNPVGCV